MKEFDFIAELLAPLSKGADESLSLTDDAALLPNISNGVIASDGIIENVHFLSKASPAHIMQKLIRTNVSDILAMGATPTHYTLTACLNHSVDEAWLKNAVKALENEQQQFGIHLIGGDTTKHDGSIMFSVTMMGSLEGNTAITRSGASAGDAVFVTGNIGDAALGLLLENGELTIENSGAYKSLVDQYYTPNIPFGFQSILAKYATAAIDISDGLISDLGHICKQSNVGADIMIDSIPLSDAAVSIIQLGKADISMLLTGGDDYQLLFSVKNEEKQTLIEASQVVGVSIAEIGRIIEKSDVIQCFSEDNTLVSIDGAGYSHF